jgi:hypothetical protein
VKKKFQVALVGASQKLENGKKVAIFIDDEAAVVLNMISGFKE